MFVSAKIRAGLLAAVLVLFLVPPSEGKRWGGGGWGRKTGGGSKSGGGSTGGGWFGGGGSGRTSHTGGGSSTSDFHRWNSGTSGSPSIFNWKNQETQHTSVNVPKVNNGQSSSSGGASRPIGWNIPQSNTGQTSSSGGYRPIGWNVPQSNTGQTSSSRGAPPPIGWNVPQSNTGSGSSSRGAPPPIGWNVPQSNPGSGSHLPSAPKHPEYPRQQYPQQSYPNQQYPQHSYPNQQYPQHSYPNQQYPQHSYPYQQYPQHSYPNQQYPNYQYPGGNAGYSGYSPQIGSSWNTHSYSGYAAGNPNYFHGGSAWGYKKPKGDWDWLKTAAAVHVMSHARPRVSIPVPVFYHYNQQPGWRGAVGELFDTSEEDGRTVVVIGRRPKENLRSLCRVRCTPVSFNLTDGQPCNFTCMATRCNSTAVMLNGTRLEPALPCNVTDGSCNVTKTAAICNNGTDGSCNVTQTPAVCNGTEGSCNTTQRVVPCNGFGGSCNFTCSAVPCNGTGGLCNFTCPSVPCNMTKSSTRCRMLQLNVTFESKDTCRALQNYTCKADSCNITGRSCNHTCTPYVRNRDVTNQTANATAKPTETSIISSTTVPSSSSSSTTDISVNDSVLLQLMAGSVDKNATSDSS